MLTSTTNRGELFQIFTLQPVIKRKYIKVPIVTELPPTRV